MNKKINKRRILFVCPGNHRRSPVAEIIFRQKAKDRKLSVEVASAGLGWWYLGEQTDIRAVLALEKRGYEVPRRQSVRIMPRNFEHYHKIYVMASIDLFELKAICPAEHHHKIAVFLHDVSGKMIDIEDNNYGGVAEFDEMVETIERGCTQLIKQLEKQTYNSNSSKSGG